MAGSSSASAKKKREKYKAENRREKNRQRRALKYQKFLKWCQDKWLKGTRTPKGTGRKLRKLAKIKKGGKGGSVQKVPQAV